MKLLEKHPALLVFLLALAVRLACLAANPDATVAPELYDAGRYHALAESLLAGENYEYNGHRAQVSPFYPLFIAGIYAVTGHSVAAVIVVQCLLGALMAVIVLLTGRLVAGEKTGLAAGIATALYWPLATLGIQMLSETLFLTLMAASVYYLLKGLESFGNRRLIVSAVLLGITTLTRPVILYYLVVAVAALWFNLRREKSLRKYWLPLLYAALAMMVLLPWGARNKAVMGTWIFTNTNTGQVLLTGNLPRDGKKLGFDLTPASIGLENAEVLSLPELERNQALKKMAIEHLRDKQTSLVRLIMLKIAYLFSPFDWELLGNNKGLFNPWFVWLVIFGIPGLFLIRWRWPTWLIPLLILYFVAISMVTYSSPRLRIPIIPYVLIAAGAGWVRLENRLGSRWKSGGLFAFIVLTCVVGYRYSTPIKESASSLLSSMGLW